MAVDERGARWDDGFRRREMVDGGRVMVVFHMSLNLRSPGRRFRVSVYIDEMGCMTAPAWRARKWRVGCRHVSGAGGKTEPPLICVLPWRWIEHMSPYIVWRVSGSREHASALFAVWSLRRVHSHFTFVS